VDYRPSKSVKHLCGLQLLSYIQSYAEILQQLGTKKERTREGEGMKTVVCVEVNRGIFTGGQTVPENVPVRTWSHAFRSLYDWDSGDRETGRRNVWPPHVSVTRYPRGVAPPRNTCFAGEIAASAHVGTGLCVWCVAVRPFFAGYKFNHQTTLHLAGLNTNTHPLRRSSSSSSSKDNTRGVVDNPTLSEGG
jgi:hypothetical protein